MTNTEVRAPATAAAEGGSGTNDREAQKVEAKKAWVRVAGLLHLAAHLLWLQVHVTVFGRWFVSFVFGAWNPINRKVVIIGDDVGLGVGDWVRLGQQPGVQGYLNGLLNRDISTRLVGKGVLWTAFTASKAGTTSEDWLPVRQMSVEQKLRFANKHNKGPTRGILVTALCRVWDTCRRKGKPAGDETTAVAKSEDAVTLRGASLFEKTFNGMVGTHRDADIVIVVVGSKDRCPVAETVENLQKITEELVRRGKLVLVATIPLPPSVLVQKEVAVKFRERNTLTSTMVQQLNARILAAQIDFGEQAGVEFATRHGVDAQAVNTAPVKTLNAQDYVRAGHSQRVSVAAMAENLTKDHCFRFGGRSLNGRGYSTAATALFESLTPLMRAIDGNKELRKVL